MPDAPSLDEFAEANQTRTGYGSYIDTLPDDIQTQIRSSKAGHSTVVKWLRELGYDRATQNIVGGWRKREGWSRG
jgi:hypothetical protein